MTKLQDSAQGAAESCSGGPSGQLCGCSWYQKKYDGRNQLEPQMTASSIFSINLIPWNHHKRNKGPLTSSTGGTSKGDFNAGKNDPNAGFSLAPITTADRAGAGILTAIFLTTWLGIIAWMFLGE